MSRNVKFSTLVATEEYVGDNAKTALLDAVQELLEEGVTQFSVALRGDKLVLAYMPKQSIQAPEVA